MQITQYLNNKEKPTEKEAINLAKTLNFLEKEKIEVDLEPPKQYKGWKQIGLNKEILI